jgi:uncharacterized membrane protein
MSDLIIIGYPDEDTAARVWQELVKLEQDYLVDLEDAAIIRRDARGKMHGVQDLVQPGTSAILVVVRKTTPDKFLEALRPFGGTVQRTSLTRDAEQQLMRALHGDDEAAGTWDHGPQSAAAQS